MTTLIYFLIAIFVGVPLLIFIFWAINVFRVIILPNKKVIKGFFVSISRTLIIIGLCLLGLGIAALIYYFESPNLEVPYEPKYDNIKMW